MLVVAFHLDHTNTTKNHSEYNKQKKETCSKKKLKKLTDGEQWQIVKSKSACTGIVYRRSVAQSDWGTIRPPWTFVVSTVGTGDSGPVRSSFCSFVKNVAFFIMCEWMEMKNKIKKNSYNNSDLSDILLSSFIKLSCILTSEEAVDEFFGFLHEFWILVRDHGKCGLIIWWWCMIWLIIHGLVGLCLLLWLLLLDEIWKMMILCVLVGTVFSFDFLFSGGVWRRNRSNTNFEGGENRKTENWCLWSQLSLTN